MVEVSVFGVYNLFRITVGPGAAKESWTCVHTRRKRFLWWRYDKDVICSYKNKVIYAYQDRTPSGHNFYCERCFNKYLKPKLVKSGLLW